MYLYLIIPPCHLGRTLMYFRTIIYLKSFFLEFSLKLDYNYILSQQYVLARFFHFYIKSAISSLNLITDYNPTIISINCTKSAPFKNNNIFKVILTTYFILKLFCFFFCIYMTYSKNFIFKISTFFTY